MTFSFSVIADDFTGACDVGVQFEKYGMETAVLTDTGKLEDLEGKFDILVIDTESRNVSPEIAYRKVRDTLKTLEKIGVELLYKKIDSTLRGNIGAELNAVIDELNLKAVIVTPAFPAHNRTTINGCLFVNNILLERTDFARDPLNPLNESHIPTLIKHQTKRRIGHINLSKIRSGVNHLKDEIQRLIEDGTQIIVADAETPNDLAKIAKASMDLDILPCGSAGLAEHISRLLVSRSRLLVVSGSVNSATLNQIATAEEKLDVKVLEPDLSEVLTSQEKLETAIKNLVHEAEGAVAEGKNVVIRLAKSKDLILKFQKLGKELGMSKLQVAEKLLLVLSEASKRIIENHKFTGLILIGGDTSIKVMNVIGAEGIKLENEVLPGVPIGRILGGKHEGMQVITKAGGFGDKHALVKIMKSMSGRRIE